jgi:hypothetical protein
MRQAIAPEAAELVARYPAITSCRVTLEALDGSSWNARVDVLLPQHQLIVNASGETEAAARSQALAAAEKQMRALITRHPELGRNANC